MFSTSNSESTYSGADQIVRFQLDRVGNLLLYIVHIHGPLRTPLNTSIDSHFVEPLHLLNENPSSCVTNPLVLCRSDGTTNDLDADSHY